MRPIFWGLIASAICAVGWVISTVFAVVTLGSFRTLANVFGILMIASVPVALVCEVILWIKKRKN